MWVTRTLFAPRVVSRRFISLMAVALITAVFAVLGPLVQPAAAESAIWSGDELTYEGNAYTREQINPIGSDDERQRAGEYVYTWTETLSNGDQKAQTLFF